MRAGNFSELLGPQIGSDALGRPIFQGEIYDPATTRPDGRGGFIRDPFTFNGQLNVIDPARLSPISTFFQNGYKLPTTAGRNRTFFFGTLNILTMANDGPFAFFSGITSQTVPT